MHTINSQPGAGMKILNFVPMYWRNRFSDAPVMALRVELQESEKWLNILVPQSISNALLKYFPELGGLQLGLLSPVSVAQQIQSGGGVGPTDLAAAVAISLQQRNTEVPSIFGSVRDDPMYGDLIYFAYEDSILAEQSGRTAMEIVNKLFIASREVQKTFLPESILSDAINDYRQAVQHQSLDPDTVILLEKAKERRIPWFRIKGTDQVQLGHGRYQKRIGSVTERESYLAILNSRDIRTTYEMLIGVGLPVPQSWLVQTPEEAMKSAEDIGFPVAVKPRHRKMDDKAHIGVEKPEAVHAAYQNIANQGRGVIVEKFIEGNSYKIFVVGDRLVSSIQITGDEAIDAVAVDVTDQVHPDNRLLAVQAVKTLGLNAGSIDFVTRDIGESWHETGGAICGVGPRLNFRLQLAANPKQDVVSPILDTLLGRSNGRIPIAAITGTNGKTTTTRMLTAILRQAGYHVGNATTDGVDISGDLVVASDVAGWWGAHRVLSNPTIDAAVLETARGGLIQRGMAFDWCNVSAVLNVDVDHLGHYGIATLDDMARLKRRVALAAQDAVILNADDPYCLAMAKQIRAAAIVLISLNPRSRVIKEHVQAGGRAYVCAQRKGHSVLLRLNRSKRSTLMAADEIPATWNGRAVYNVFNAMAAAAMAQELGVPPELIKKGLMGFKSSTVLSAGRLNYFNGCSYDVLLDQAHHVPGLKRFVQFFDRLSVKGRRILVFTFSGRKSDDELRDCVAILVGHFDQYIAYERPDWRKGREAGEISKVLSGALVENRVSKSRVKAGIDLAKASTKAVKIAKPGDLIVVLGSVTTGDSRNNMKETLELFNV
jgi:UDP-N-acetylmuramyl tripeptide synthase